MPFAAEQERDTPKCANTDKSVNDTGNDGAGSSADPGDKVKLEETDKPPVEPADDQQCQCNFVKHFRWGRSCIFLLDFSERPL